jgi:hypothetical protein
VLTVASSAFLSAYVVLGVEPPGLAANTLGYILVFFVILWVLEDARRLRRVPCFDYGFFLALGFPVSVVWYLLWTRGLRGLLTLGIFVGLYLAPWVFAVAVWVAMTVLGMRR